MASDELKIQPGRPGNLTPDQEEKLKELWQLSLRLFTVPEPPAESNGSDTTPPPSTKESSDTDGGEQKKKKSRLSIFPAQERRRRLNTGCVRDFHANGSGRHH